MNYYSVSLTWFLFGYSVFHTCFFQKIIFVKFTFFNIELVENLALALAFPIFFFIFLNFPHVFSLLLYCIILYNCFFLFFFLFNFFMNFFLFSLLMLIFFYLVIRFSWYEYRVWWVNLIWRVIFLFSLVC
jgi:hypothetical protein